MAKFEIINNSWIKQLEDYERQPMPLSGPYESSWITKTLSKEHYKAIKISAINYIDNHLSEEREIQIANKFIKIPSGYYATINLMTEKNSLSIYYFNNEIELYNKDLIFFENLLMRSNIN